MNKPIQQRAIKTRQKLLDAATSLITKGNYENLRVEDVVKTAGVAKGTFFSHFADKDALLAEVIGAQFAKITEQMQHLPPPQSTQEMAQNFAPLIELATSERIVFDIIMRYSGAGRVGDIGPIAQQFEAQGMLHCRWVAQGPFRKDVDIRLLGEGIGAFLMQAIALDFCELHNSTDLQTRFAEYLDAWLVPPRA